MYRPDDVVYITEKGKRYLQKLKERENKVTEKSSVVKKNLTTEKNSSVIKK